MDTKLCLYWITFLMTIFIASCSDTSRDERDIVLKSTHDMLPAMSGQDSIFVADLYSSLVSKSSLSNKEASNIVLAASHALFTNRRYTDIIIYNNSVHNVIKSFDPYDKETQTNAADIAMFVCAAYQQLGMNDRAIHGYELLLKKLNEYKLDDRASVIYTNLANLRMKKHEFDKSIFLQKKSLEINKRANDSIGIIYNYSNLASTYVESGDNEKAIEYQIMALHMAQEAPDSSIKFLIMRNLSTNYSHMKEWSMAKKYLEPALRFHEANNMVNELPITYSKYGEILMMQGDPDNARTYFDKSIALLDQLGPSEKIAILESYLNAHNRVNSKSPIDPKTVSRLINLTDSVIGQRTDQTVNSVVNLYDSEIESLEATAEEERTSFHNKLFLVVAVIIAMAAGIIFILVRCRVMKNRNQNAEKEIEDLNNTILSLSDKIDHNKAFLSTIGSDLEALRGLLEVRNTQQSREKLRRILAAVLAEADTDKENAVYVADTAFHQKLLSLYPNLTPRDLKICSLLRQGYDNKEMARILCREVRSVEAARNRIRKKCGIDSGTDLYIHLLNIDKES